jgi:hypothetical protein
MAKVLSSDEAAIVEEVRRLAARAPSAWELPERRRAIEDIRRLRTAMAPIDLTLEELLADDDEGG